MYKIVARNYHLLLTRDVSLGLNGSDLEQMSDNKDGILPLELVDIWNESFGYSVMWCSSLLWWWISMDVPAQTHQTNKQDQRYQKMVYSSILVTKESNNKMNDCNIIHYYGEGTNFALKMKKRDYNHCLSVVMLL